MRLRRPAGVPPVLLPDGEHAGQVLDARLHLLDRQVLDRTGTPVTTVDDLELAALPPSGAALPAAVDLPVGGETTLVVSALLTGPVLLGRLLGGRPPSSRVIRVPWGAVASVRTVVRLGVDGESLDATWVERWVRDRFIARIPGGRHDPR